MYKITFLATDGMVLDGFLQKGKENTNTILLAVHGMASNALKERDEIIAKKVKEIGMDYFSFNNRGSELVKYGKKMTEKGEEKKLIGTSYEDVLEGYEDIVGAILKLKELGYQKIYLQGHSLGSTKIVYTYHKLKEQKEKILENIKGILLLSLVDIPNALKIYLGEKFKEYLVLAEKKEQEGRLFDFMPKEAFLHPITVKTFLRYARDYQKIDFANFGKDTEYHVLNRIDIPLFMRWGNEKEMIQQEAEQLVNWMNTKITNSQKDISYIQGANHSYQGKEEILAEQMVKFIQNIK